MGSTSHTRRMTERRLILCGDSILDNGAYVGPGGRPLHDHLREFLPEWQIDFRALDGASGLPSEGFPS